MPRWCSGSERNGTETENLFFCSFREDRDAAEEKVAELKSVILSHDRKGRLIWTNHSISATETSILKKSENHSLSLFFSGQTYPKSADEDFELEAEQEFLII